MTIYIGVDHGGVELKRELITKLGNLDYNVKDLGTHNTQSVDYPEYAQKVANKVSQNKNSLGVLICRTGIGMSIAANKAKGIRAALCYNPQIAIQSRKHNDANIICFGADYISSEEAWQSLQNFLNTKFEGARHKRRIDKL